MEQKRKKKEEDGDGGPGINEPGNVPQVPVGSHDLRLQGAIGDTLTTLAQHDWLTQYMPDDGNDWADNAMLMLQHLGMPEYAGQYQQSSVEERIALLKYYASHGHRVPPPPTDVSAVCRGQEVSMEGLRNFMQAAVNSGATPFQTIDLADAHQSSSIQIESEYQAMSREEGIFHAIVIHLHRLVIHPFMLDLVWEATIQMRWELIMYLIMHAVVMSMN
jgi:hypothetical protein